MRYVSARLEEKRRDDTYRIYVTKSLQLIPQNKNLVKDLTDLWEPQNVDKRTGNDIANDIIKRAGLKFGE